ncbi:hypothetical protein CRUP_037384 [Coryphaenoides rupestris]|nr:hypothetical protein CRUP_037384 [Coryphaenoides rupestris]
MSLSGPETRGTLDTQYAIQLCTREACVKRRARTFCRINAKDLAALFILVHVGFLTEESGDVFSPKVLKGGPLGEMVQWADILTALHVLGHNLKISMSVKELHG